MIDKQFLVDIVENFCYNIIRKNKKETNVVEKIFIYNNQETNYIITSDGRVINRKTNKELKGTLARNEYRSVQLTIEGKPKSFMVHRLVATMFCDNPNNYEIVDHIDRNKYNNDYTNLRWVDNSTNALNVDNKNFIKNINNIDLDNLDPSQWIKVKRNPQYMVNKDGQIINTKTKKILKGSIRNGYIRINIQKKWESLHRLIWESFNDTLLEKEQIIDHIDGNRLNNKLSNLRLVTQSENVLNGHINGHNGDISVKQYDLQGNYITTYFSMKAAAEAVNKTKDAVRSAANRHGTCAGYFWIREDDDISIEKLIKTTKANKPKKNYIGVTQYSLDGKKIAYFNSLKAAAKEVGCADSTIKRAADNYRPGKGFIWVLDTQKIEDFNINTSPENSLIAGKS